jgi:hypothetical protein
MGNSHETYVKLYVNVEDQASITCPKCKAVKVANVKKTYRIFKRYFVTPLPVGRGD